MIAKSGPAGASYPLLSAGEDSRPSQSSNEAAWFLLVDHGMCFHRSLLVATALVVSFLAPGRLLAHCDGLDGPVVTAAREALGMGEVSRVLIWVSRKDEPEIRKAFAQALAVRKLGPEARELADTYFFETLVRVHRAGEGAAYTGLQPAGRNLGPAIPAADKALQTGNVEPLVKLLADAVRFGARQHFKHAEGLKGYQRGDVEAGRRYVNAYVVFVHYVERLYEAVHRPAEGHYAESAAAGAHHD